jgi:hypothetical protein
MQLLVVPAKAETTWNQLVAHEHSNKPSNMSV